jgi:hypothetical protein
MSRHHCIPANVSTKIFGVRVKTPVPNNFYSDPKCKCFDPKCFYRVILIVCLVELRPRDCHRRLLHYCERAIRAIHVTSV